MSNVTVQKSLSDYDRVQEAADFLTKRLPEAPDIAVVLGSGFGGFTEHFDAAITIDSKDIPHWPGETVVGHAGQLRYGVVGRRRVVVLSGRAHLYQGYNHQTVAFSTRVVGALGVKLIVLTNAAGAICHDFTPGNVRVIDDHINAMGKNPLVGSHDARFGVRCPDMSQAYRLRLGRLAETVGASLGISVVHGIYVGVLGPSFETPAEIKYFRMIGADAVGMSTVPEVIVARQIGLEILGLSFIANMAAGVLPTPLNHLDVLKAVKQAVNPLSALLSGIIEQA